MFILIFQRHHHGYVLINRVITEREICPLWTVDPEDDGNETGFDSVPPLFCRLKAGLSGWNNIPDVSSLMEG